MSTALHARSAGAPSARRRNVENNIGRPALGRNEDPTRIGACQPTCFDQILSLWPGLTPCQVAKIGRMAIDGLAGSPAASATGLRPAPAAQRGEVTGVVQTNYVPIKEAAFVAKCSVDTMKRWAKRDGIGWKDRSGRWYIDLSRLELSR